jgi:hypothetical protein
VTTWAATGDDRLLAYENATALADLLNDSLTTYKVRDRQGNPPDLDDVGFVIESVSDVVLGERGRRVDHGRVAFTYEQVVTMAELLGALLPVLAEEAHTARQEHARRMGRLN